MVCYNPKPAREIWVRKINEKTGEIYDTKEIKFISWQDVDEKTPFKNGVTMIPCGKCEGCMISKSQDWATRCYLESQNHAVSCFLTLTYSNDNLPKKRTLKKADLQKFWKRLRKATGKKILYLACGEYGPRTLRPHYHAAVFGWKPTDLKPYKKNPTGDWLYTSKETQKIWGKGFVVVGQITYESAAYIARYVMKKAYGITDEIHLKANKEKEFNLSSRRPALGLWAFKDKKEWEKIKRNNGIFVKTKTGVILKKIPQYLKEKWKNIDNRKEYFKEQEETRARILNDTRTRLDKTSNNYWKNLKQTVEITKKKLKILDKRGNTEIK